MGEEVVPDRLETARRIKEAQGDYEADVTCSEGADGGCLEEADLHQHYKSPQLCSKNPGHTHFKPIQDFNIEHLPPDYRYHFIYDWIRAEADLTCYLLVTSTVNARPQFFPGSQEPYPCYQDKSGKYQTTWRGTGWVKSVKEYRGGVHVTICTACHIVFDSEEARGTKCIFGYDTGETLIKECPTLTGLRFEYSDIEKDACVMTCVTHDVELMEMLLKMESHRREMREKVMDKYGPSMNKGLSDPGVSYRTNPSPCPVVIISHPHGCNKQLTFGKWTGRHTCGETPKRKGDDWEYDYIDTRYTYNADTCHGSSGAPVIRLMDPQRWWMGADYHPHSKGTGNNNKSGVVPEIVSPPTPSQEMLLNKIMPDSKPKSDDEAKVSHRKEADLHKHYRRCRKNPGHTQFVPVKDFKIEHLPPDYRDKDILDWIRAEADLTCRVSVRYTSESRPKFHPEYYNLFYPFYQDRGYDWMRVGTGYVSNVYKYTEKDMMNCVCQKCREPGTHTPKKDWGEVIIFTACHVTFDSDEARHTTCHFFYDIGSTHISCCPSLESSKVEKSDIKGDWCVITCVTHDMDLVDKLCELDRRRACIKQKLIEKYRYDMNDDLIVPGTSSVTDPKPGVAVIISHPHGLSKMVTVGWKHRHTCSETMNLKLKGWETKCVKTTYNYNTHTCPGSSGAPVLILPEKGKLCLWSAYHVHSEGGDGNDNKSALWVEFISPLTRSVTKKAQLNESLSPLTRSVTKKASLNEHVSFLIRFVEEKAQLKQFVSFLTRSVEKTVLLQKFVILLTRSVDKKVLLVLDVFVSFLIKSVDNEALLNEFVSFLIRFMVEKAQLDKFFSFLTRSMADEPHLDEIVSFLTRSVNNLVVD